MPKFIETKKDLIIRKPENLVKARYKLSPLAIKFLSTIIANIKRSDDVNEEYVIKVKDFRELTDQKTNRIYELIDEALGDLLKNPLKVLLDEHQMRFLVCNWVSSAVYDAGQVSFLIDKRLRPLLIEVKEKFLKYKLENILNLRSSYSIRLYEVLKDWLEFNKRYKNKVEKIISIDEIREMLEIPKSYRYPDIKRQILNRAKNELEKHTDIIFNFEEIKTGRKVTHLHFYIYQNPKKQNDNLEQNNYFLNQKTFVALLRKNYSGNGKFFGFKRIEDKNYWLGLDNNGLLYGVNGEIKDFNSTESSKIYDLWLTIAQNSSLYQGLLLKGENIKELAEANKDLWFELKEEINKLKENRVI